jgi:flagellar hook assembly protein FlgD
MTSFAVRIPAAGRTRVELLDVAGRLVRVLHDGFAAAGALPLRWDGADAAGRAAPAGLYFVRAISHGSVATDRFVRVR